MDFCTSDDCYNVLPCFDHPIGISYEVSSCGTRYSGFNDDAREDCDKSLHSHSHEHFIQYDTSQPRYTYTGPLQLMGNLTEYFDTQCFEICCICEMTITDPDDFVFNLWCQHSYHRVCINQALRNGCSDFCIGCSPGFCKACVRCSY
jgi:hypothetical protein